MTARRFASAVLAVTLVVALAGAAARAAVDALRVLVLGDSITYDGGLYRWPAALSTLLTQQGVPNVVESEAFSGQTCLYLAQRVGQFLATHNPDVVYIQCGTNDKPTDLIGGEPQTGYAIRVLVETIHAYRPANPVKVVPSMVMYSDPFIWPGTADREYQTNGIFWQNYAYYLPPRVAPFSWLTGWADWQNLPQDTDVLDGTGVHLQFPRGPALMANVAYRAAAPALGWPLIAPACGLSGHPPGGTPRPTFVQCPVPT